jgi:peptide/nickel transport system permease protein
MLRFILRRLALGLITLAILSVIIFVGTHVLPGNPGRAILGPFAAEESVKQLNHELGVDKPLITQYTNWMGDLLRGDLGTSYSFKTANGTLIWDAFKNSLKLALLAFVIVVPLSILGGVIAAMRRGKLTDRVITIAGLSAATMPEFVSGVVLLTVFALWLNVLPVSAHWPPGEGFFGQIYYLLLPALTLTLVLFGYIARMARAGTAEALESDYARTAVLKGLPRRTVIFRHVLRNALLPTITVVATQTGYLLGGLVVVETLFTYNGIGQLVYTATNNKDFPLVQSAVLVIGLVYMLATLAADVLYSVLNPRIRFGGAE